MRKVKIITVIASFVIFFSSFSVFASTDTKERTEDNYLVPSYIEITELNKSAILTTPAVDASEKIYDYAELLTDTEEKEVYQRISDFVSSSELDLAIVTINENNKGTAKEYAQDFYDYNAFGTDTVHSGILFLVDMETREIYMVTTGKAITMYDDARIDTIVSDIYTYFSDKEYAKGMTKFVTILDNYDKLGLPSNNDTKYVIGSDGTLSRKIPWFIFLVCPVLATIIVMAILIHKNRLVRKATSSKEYLKKDSVDIKLESDQFLGSNVTKIRIDHSSSSGGSSTSSGSSGISHGGGGHKF